MTYEEFAAEIAKLSESDKKKEMIATDWSGVTEYVAVISRFRLPCPEDDPTQFPQLRLEQVDLKRFFETK